MASYDESRGFDELEKLLWQTRVKESLAGCCTVTDKVEDSKTKSEQAASNSKS